MLKIRVDHCSPRCSVDSRRSSVSFPFSPPLKLVEGRTRKSFSYAKLPEEPIKLSVLKLDGSCFDVQVMQIATISELREAVEAVFSHMPKKGVGKISWPHVWGNFCLCFDNQKLVMETDFIRNYGIKDGDQLHFISHHSPCFTLIKKPSKKRTVEWKQRNMSWLLRDNLEAEGQDDRQDRYDEKLHNDRESDDEVNDLENGSYEHEDLVECRENHFLKGWFSYSRIPNKQRSRCGKASSIPSRSACDFLGSLRKIINIWGCKGSFARDTRRED